MPIKREFFLTLFEGHWYPGYLCGVDARAGCSSGGLGAFAGVLETHLGLPSRMEDPVRRRLETVKVLGAAVSRDPRLFFAASFGLDPEGTAGRLLYWRDTLLWAGWTGSSGDLPPRIKAAIEALPEKESANASRTLAERILAIIETIGSGGEKIFDVLHLAQVPEDLPPLVGRLLDALRAQGTVIRPWPIANADKQTGDLRAAAKQIQEKTSFTPKGDGTLKLLAAGTPVEAAEALAAWLARRGMEDLALIVPEPFRAELDEAFKRFHLPALGSAEGTAHLPALQVLPLYLTLQWEPLDPEVFLEFLTLAISPLPAYAARPLAEAFSKYPGIGNKEWEKAMAKAKEGAKKRAGEKGKDPGEEWDRTLAWLPHPGTLLSSSAGMPLTQLAEVCAQVSGWAGRRAKGMRSGAPEELDETLLASLDAAAAQADRLLILAECAERPEFSAIEIRRLLVLAQEEVQTKQRTLEEGAPAVVRDPAALLAPAGTVVWWGFTGSSAEAIPASPFTALEARALADKGIHLPEPSRRALTLAEGWARPLLTTNRQLLLVTWDQRLGEAEVPHPLWHQLTASLKPDQKASLVLTIRDMLDAPSAGFETGRAPVPGRTLPRARRKWALQELPAALKESESATSLNTLASCPLKHVLERQAKLEPARAVELIALPLLLGHLSHAILESVFAADKTIPTEAAARREVDAQLAERVPKEAAILLQPGQEVRLARFRRAVHRSALELARLMRKEGLKVTATEQEVKGGTEIASIRGYIDMLMKDRQDRACILDLKYSESGESKYISTLRDEPVQLAIYARLVDLDAPVAYFSLGDAQFISGKDNPFPGARGVKSLTARETWDRLCVTANAIHEEQFKKNQILATGVTDATGTEKGVPKAEGGLQSMKPPCDWCDYGALCGKQWSEAEEDDDNHA